MFAIDEMYFEDLHNSEYKPDIRLKDLILFPY